MGDSLVSGGIDADAFGKLASSVKLNDPAEEDRRVVEAALAAARGSRGELVRHGRRRPPPLEPIDSAKGEGWQVVEVAASLEKALKEKAFSEVPKPSVR